MQESIYKGALNGSNFQGNQAILSNVKDHFKTQNFVGFNKNDFYRQYNAKLTEQFENLMQDKGFNIYQNGLFKSNQEHEGLDKLLINSEHISPLLKALEDENSVLKKEINYLSGDLKKFISMVELLLEENKCIREHINQKNRDIQKLIETIGLNDGEEIHDLKHKIHILTEENNILIKHLDEVKMFREDYDNFVFQNETEMAKAKEIFEKAQDDLNNALRREENLVKQIETLQPNYLKFKKISAEQEDEIEQLKTMVNEKENYSQSIENELNHYKRNYEDLNNKKGLENDQLLQENHVLNNEKKDLKSKLQLKEKQIQQLQDESKQSRREHQQISQQLADISSAINDSQNQVKIEKSRAESSLQREKQMREKLDLALNESEKATLKLQQLERQYNALLDSSKLEVQEKHSKYENIIENLKLRQAEQIDEKEEENNILIKSNTEQKRAIERLQSELEQKQREYNESKAKLTDYQHQKRIIDAQTLELRQQQNEIQELNSLLNDYKANMQSQPSIRQEQDQLLRQIQDLEDKCKELELQGVDQQQRDEYELLEQKYENLRQENESLHQSNETLRNEITDVRREMDSMLEAGVNSRLSKRDQEIKLHELSQQSNAQIMQLKQQVRQLEDENTKLLRNQQNLQQSQQQPVNNFNSNQSFANQQNYQQPQTYNNRFPEPQQNTQAQRFSVNPNQTVANQGSKDGVYQQQSIGSQLQQNQNLYASQSPSLKGTKKIFDNQPPQDNKPRFSNQDWLKNN